MLKFFSILLASSSIAFSGVYMVPQEYDNMVASVKSNGFGIITNSTPRLSGNSYTIGGQSARYRCLVVPKINCTASTAVINATASEHSLRDPSTEGLLDTFQIDIRLEDENPADPNANFLVCGAGYGGQVWDDSQLTSATVSGNTQLTYTYVPNSKTQEEYYFTNIANASSQSYVSVSYSQVCQ